VPLGLAKYNPVRFFISTLAGKLVLCYVIVMLSHYFGGNYVEPFLQDIKDPTPIYLGLGIFVAMMAAAIFLLLRLNWEKILGRIAPWTVQKNNDGEN
jgi:membrane protein DedA with SNARE-associated domain